MYLFVNTGMVMERKTEINHSLMGYFQRNCHLPGATELDDLDTNEIVSGMDKTLIQEYFKQNTIELCGKPVVMKDKSLESIFRDHLTRINEEPVFKSDAMRDWNVPDDRVTLS